MNNIIKHLYFLVILLLLASCNKEPELFTLEAPADQMKITASVSDLVLDKAKENENAVTFSWNKATNRGDGTEIKYVFRMYMVENKDNVTDLYEIPADQYSISFTHKQLNDILKAWGASTDNKITVEAEVIAQVVSEKQFYMPELSKTTMEITGFLDNLEQIYLVIVPDDNSEKQYIRMGESVQGSGIYRASADLSNCSFFFSEKPDEDYPGYFLGDNGDYSLQYESEGGTYLRYGEEGEHVIIVDLSMMDVRIIQPIYELPYNGIWIVGSACDVGWPSGNDLESVLREKGALHNDDPRYPERWTYTGNFYKFNGNDNSFKLCLKIDGMYGGEFFFAPSENVDPVVNHELGEAREQGSQDYKWAVKSYEDGVYTLVVDLSEMTIDLQPAKQ